MGVLDPDVRVLVVEDDFIIAFDLEERLVDLGAGEIRIARSISDAAEQIREWPPNIALVDWRLGDGTAADFVRDLLAAQVKVIIVSGSSRSEMKFVDEDAVVFLHKPLADAALRAALLAMPEGP